MTRFVTLVLLGAGLTGIAAAACTSSSDNKNQGGGGASLATLYVANGSTSSVSVVDTETLKVVDTIQLDREYHPHHWGLSPDGKTALLAAPNADLSAGHGAEPDADAGGAEGGGLHGGAHAGGGGASEAMSAVYAINTSTRKSVRLAEIDATVHNAAFTRDGKQVLLGMMEHGMLMAYDATSFKELWSLRVGEMPLEVSLTPDRKTALVALSTSSELAVVDLATKKVTTLPVGMVPIGAWLSGDDAYVTNEGDKTVTSISLKRLAVQSTFDAGGTPGQAFASPDGKELWIALEDEGKVRIADPQTGRKLAELAAGVKPHGIVFEPSGKRVFVSDEGDGKVLVFDRAKRSLLGKVEVGGQPNGLLWVGQP